jgi:hypothetical protein
MNKMNPNLLGLVWWQKEEKNNVLRKPCPHVALRNVFGALCNSSLVPLQPKNYMFYSIGSMRKRQQWPRACNCLMGWRTIFLERLDREIILPQHFCSKKRWPPLDLEGHQGQRWRICRRLAKCNGQIEAGTMWAASEGQKGVIRPL